MFGKVEYGEQKTLPEDAKVKLKYKTLDCLLKNKRDEIDAFINLLNSEKAKSIMNLNKDTKFENIRKY
jgi:hypothetical protein